MAVDTAQGDRHSLTFEAGQLPKRLATALNDLAKLNELGIYLLPIRHHSPACAYATNQALVSIEPNAVLIEAPASFNEMLEDLKHPDNKPPLAVLCQTQVSYFVTDSDSDSVEIESEDLQSNKPSDKSNSSDKQKSKRLVQHPYSAYFPFCEYSPEWVALRYASQGQENTDTSQTNTCQTGRSTLNSCQLQCIDLPFSEQVAHRQWVLSEQNWESQSLQQERYLAHSTYIKRLAEKLHCRDHDEVWEHLFELDSIYQLRDWQTFFDKVLVWCAMSRLDYEQKVLVMEGSVVREDYMSQRIIECYQSLKSGSFKKSKNSNNPLKDTPKIVVVTGGFHTLALIESLQQSLLSDTNKEASQPLDKPSDTSTKSIDTTHSTTANQSITTSADESWLIRYSFDKLDALNGYASGMPSPAFYQACWEQMVNCDEPQNRLQLVINFLSDFSHQLRKEQITQSNYITVKTASEQAMRLAELREHRLIGRYDLIDACASSFLKGSNDEGSSGFHRLLQQNLSGSKLGEVVSSQRTPPILAQVYELVKANRFKLNDTLSKTAKLDVLRNSNHRKRSCLLHLLAFLDVGFARRQSGPDFLNGGQLHLLFEEWQYAWTPQVESRLIELSEQGSDIYQLATTQLLRQRQDYAEQGQNQSSAQLISLLIQASLMGLTSQINVLFDEMTSILPKDPDLGSVIACGQHLLYLWTGKAFLQLQKDEQLATLIAEVPSTALFLLSQLQNPNEDQVSDTLAYILSLHNLLKQIGPIINDTSQVVTQALSPDNSMSVAAENEQRMVTTEVDLIADFHKTLSRLLPSWQDIELLVGAVHALEFIDGITDETSLALRLKQHFGVGANAETAVAYISGMLQAVPTLFLHYSEATAMLDRLITSWDEETFISLLPDLRLAFTGLKPIQTNDLANQVANLHGVSAAQVTQYQGQLSESDLMHGLGLNQRLQKLLHDRGLQQWFGVE